MWGSRFPTAAVPSYAKEARDIVACAGIAGRRRDQPHRCGPQTI